MNFPSLSSPSTPVGAAGAAVALALASLSAEGASWFDGTRTWYYESVSGGASVTGASFVSQTLSVPAAVSGLPVVAIGDGAFTDADILVSLTLPASLRTIGEGAFFGCDGLASVTIPASVSSIGDWAFSHCSSLASFSVASGSPSFSASGGVLYDAARSTLVRWPGGKAGACSVPVGVARIGTGAFCGADRVTSVSLPASVTAIGERAFAHCGALASFSVASGNPAFAVSSSADARGALVSRDGKTLVCVPAAAAKGASYVAVPAGVETVAPSAMAGLAGLSSVSLPASVLEIGRGAFLGCSSLVFVDSDAAADACGPGATSSVESVGDEAFLWCRSLREAPLGRNASRVGRRAFAGCRSLAALELGPDVSSVGSSAFSECTSLSRIRWHGGAPSAGAVAADAFVGSSASLSVVADAGASGWPSSLPSGSSTSRAVVRDPGLSPVYRLNASGREHFYTASAGEKTALVSSGSWRDEGVVCFAEPFPCGKTVPVYRFVSSSTHLHFFTASLGEKRALVRSGTGWNFEGIAFHAFPSIAPGFVPVYRFASSARHFYTSSESEKAALAVPGGAWRFEGVAFFAAPSASGVYEKQVASPGPAVLNEVRRFCSFSSGSHFYTMGSAEIAALSRAGSGWRVEGVAFRASPSYVEGTVPLYRFNSPSIRDHFFTAGAREAMSLMRTSPGWLYEGVAGYVLPAAGEGTVPVYRFCDGVRHFHFFTASVGEMESLCAAGGNWRYEGVAFHAWPAADVPSGEGEKLRSVAAIAPKTVFAPVSVASREASGEVPDAFWADAPLETVSDAPGAVALSGSAETAVLLDPPVLVSAPLPADAVRVQLWRADAGVVLDAVAEGGEDGVFEISAAGPWHWLRAFDPDGSPVLSLWFRIPPESVPEARDAASGIPEPVFQWPCSISSQLR